MPGDAGCQEPGSGQGQPPLGTLWDRAGHSSFPSPHSKLCLVACPEKIPQWDRGRKKIPLPGKGKPITCSRLAVRRDVGIKIFFGIGCGK